MTFYNVIASIYITIITYFEEGICMKLLKKQQNSKTIQHLRNIKIRNRLLFIFLFVSLVPVTCIGFYAYKVYTKSINDKLERSNNQAMYLLNQNFITELDSFRMYIGTISINEDCQRILSQAGTDDYVINDKDIQTINDFRTKVPFPSIYLKNLRILDRNRNIVYDLGYDDINSERFAEIVETIDEASPDDSLQYIHTYRGKDKIVLARKVYNVANLDEHIGYILVYLDENFFSNTLFTNVSFGNDSNIMLVRSDGYIISSQERSLLGTQINTNLLKKIQKNKDTLGKTFYFAENKEKQVVISTYNDNLDYYLIATFPYSYISDETRLINIVLMGIALFLILFCLYITLLVYNSIMQPINHIVSVCGATSGENLNIAIGDTCQDELGFLGRSIDGMIQEIQMFNVRWTHNQEQKRNLELEVLQYQINTHFLFNTLNSLRVVAQMNDVPILEKGISSLSFLLQQTLVKKQELIPISLEIENLNHYFTIQSIRYAGMFEVEYHLDEKTLSYEIPRFVLQPLAENAIIHGTADNEEPITISVESRFIDQNTIEIMLHDNGCGFDSKNNVRASKTHTSGIGVNNVEKRIKLHYGSQYGLKIESTLKEGTACYLTIPCRLYVKKEIETDDKNSADLLS